MVEFHKSTNRAPAIEIPLFTQTSMQRRGPASSNPTGAMLGVLRSRSPCFGRASLGALDSQDKDAIFQELFAPGVGANFTICQMPIGANHSRLMGTRTTRAG